MHFLHDKKRFFTASVVLLGLLLCAIAVRVHYTKGKLKFYKETRMMMGTYVTISAYHTDREYLRATVTEAFRSMEAIASTMTIHNPDSELSKLNKSPKPGIYPLSDSLFEILAMSDRLFETTKGAFDVTAKPLLDLWKSAEKQNRLPSGQDIKKTLQSVGWNKVILYALTKKIAFTVPGIEITLDGIVPGYAADKAVGVLRRAGIQNCLVDAGGEIYCSGQPGKNEFWRVGIRDPFKNDTVLEVLCLKDVSVSTSGNYERFYTIGGKRYTPIFDPRSGRPVEEILSATVIGPVAAITDGWSTAIMVLGSKKGIQLAQKAGHVEAFIISTDGKNFTYHRTPGFSQFEKK